MQDNSIKSIVIVGGGTAGWMTAAALANLLKDTKITLIESDQIGTVGVGEATLPHLRFFIQRLGIDEHAFMRATNATYKMGIEFINWGEIGDAYIHPFGDFGHPIKGIDFHHYYVKLHQQGLNKPIGQYSLPVMASKAKKFAYPSTDEKSILSTYSYAFHMDAGLFSNFLRDYSETRGVTRFEGMVTRVNQCNESGFIKSVTLNDETEFDADFFIDCSGFKGLLIEQCLKTGYDDWRHWLPCDRAIAIPTQATSAPLPYTKATARNAGWQWRIPLQNRVGNGHIYSSPYMNDDTALETLLANIDGKPISEPNFLRFTTGKRKKAWSKNCVAIGLSAGFLEPLESTSIHLIQLGIMKLLDFFPDRNCDEIRVNEYNRMMQLEFERLRDFLVLHYHATQRSDSAFWNYVRTMPLPAGLDHKIKLFKERGRVVQYSEGLFLKASWLAVYFGQGIIPTHYDWQLDTIPTEHIVKQLDDIESDINSAVHQMPSHADSIAQHCALAKSWRTPPPRASFSLYGG
ncbi:tryptophan 7-halogenase [Alteromonas sediminis]|uniref:Tryptophan 7-halogenase n=1 Tax=Alteromonas sediminis TaxID=2259342 RepID=A0A3N5YEI2_9ALTE|nr:tryptophan halogenase family protein [Alteromonas sediminis]RPJ68155.1 tryptophan 7-halogenase [Alteromonas sediminis]